MKTAVILLMVACSFCSCEHKVKGFLSGSAKEYERQIYLQAFGDVAAADVAFVKKEISKVCPRIQIKQTIPLPAFAFYKPRNRYRADSLIQFLKGRTSRNEVTIGLTNKDISTSKGNVADWGVMGLGFCPGNACVASSFRVLKNKRQEQFFKVAIHELGHTEGLPHCPVKTCFMRDAAGGNPINEETGFCHACKLFLTNKGWAL